MRNYVIINGVNSLTIPGLAIKSLPPITKPVQRTLREEIDGRDGDLITELGYGAYDKEIEIGLFGNFDVDQIIAYFNQKGTITFSNEPDKVYYFQALAQVDYEELIKFREAGVTLHCQPFKYPLTATSQELIAGDNTITNQGNIYSKPLITISGNEIIGVYLNGIQLFTIDMEDIETIAIDTEKMEAYDPNTSVLLNRHVTGNYSKFKIAPGENTITLTGDIDAATLTGITRWV